MGEISENSRKSIQRVQRQTYETDIQESKELDEKVIIRKHNDCNLIVPTNVLYCDVENFEKEKLKYYYEHWKKYTSDTRNGLKLDFNKIPFQHNFLISKEELSIINSEIQKLKSKKVIVKDYMGISSHRKCSVKKRCS